MVFLGLIGFVFGGLLTKESRGQPPASTIGKVLLYGGTVLILWGLASAFGVLMF